MTVLARESTHGRRAHPAGNDDPSKIDTPVKLMLDDARAEAARLIAHRQRSDLPQHGRRAGGWRRRGQHQAPEMSPPSRSAFLNVGGRRVPVYVIAIAPPTADVASLQAIASNTGGQYFEITKRSSVNATGQGVPAGGDHRAQARSTCAIQHAFANSADFNTVPTVVAADRQDSEFQVTSPIIGSVNLDGARRTTRCGAGSRTQRDPQQAWRHRFRCGRTCWSRRFLAARLRTACSAASGSTSRGRWIEGVGVQVCPTAHCSGPASDACGHRSRNLYTILSDRHDGRIRHRQRPSWRR